jgi:hypothetical protein
MGEVRFIDGRTGLPLSAELTLSDGHVVQALIELVGGERPVRLVRVDGCWLDALDDMWVEDNGHWRPNHDGHHHGHQAAA